MDEDYSVKIIDIISNFCSRKKLRNKYINYKFNNRPHHNQKWKCKVLSSLQVFILDEKFCSFNYLDLQLGKEYIEYKFVESIVYGFNGRELKTGIRLKPIKNMNWIGKVKIRQVCRIILRHREIIREYELQHQKSMEKKKTEYKTNMESFL